MKRIAIVARSWRVEVIWVAMVFCLGVAVPASADALCSTEPIYTYDSEANLCGGSAGDCYACFVWI